VKPVILWINLPVADSGCLLIEGRLSQRYSEKRNRVSFLQKLVDKRKENDYDKNTKLEIKARREVKSR